MTRPRLVGRNACVLITRRCLERQFLLRPDSEVVALFRTALAKAAADHGIRVLGATQMSNHYHLVVHDSMGRYPDFVGWLNARLTRGVNRLRGRGDTLWEARQTSVVELGDGDSVVEALAYVHLNPMAAGLVDDPKSWPGLVTGPGDFRGVKREPRDVGNEALQVLEVEVPPTHKDLSPEDFATLLEKRIEERAQTIRAAMKRLGRTFGTAADALKVAWQAAPTQSLGLNMPVETGTEGVEEAGSDEDLTSRRRRRIAVGVERAPASMRGQMRTVVKAASPLGSASQAAPSQSLGLDEPDPDALGVTLTSLVSGHPEMRGRRPPRQALSACTPSSAPTPRSRPSARR